MAGYKFQSRIFLEGREGGREEGREEGRAALRRSAAELAHRKFPGVFPGLDRQLASLTDDGLLAVLLALGQAATGTDARAAVDALESNRKSRHSELEPLVELFRGLFLRGREEGRKEGRLEVLRRSAAKLAQGKFPELFPDLAQQLACADDDALLAVLLAVGEATTSDQVRAAVETLAPTTR